MVGVEPLLSRRTALATGAAVTVATLTSCGERTPAGAGDDPSGDADLRLLRLAKHREEQLGADAESAARRQPALRSALRDLADGHDEHVGDLTRSHGVHATITRVRHYPREDPLPVARDFARRERALAQAHADAALAARSGPLARVLAGLAAAAEQQAHVLDDLAVSLRGRRG